MADRIRRPVRGTRAVELGTRSLLASAAVLLLGIAAERGGGTLRAQDNKTALVPLPPQPPQPALQIPPPAPPVISGSTSQPGVSPGGGFQPPRPGGLVISGGGGPVAPAFGMQPPPPQPMIFSGPVPGVLPLIFQFKIDPKTPLKELLPATPKAATAGAPLVSDDLTKVPEVQLHTPLAKDGNALRETAHLIAKINHLNNKRHDHFMEALLGERADLNGLPVAMGDACRTKGEQSRQFQIAANTVRQALGNVPMAKSTGVAGVGPTATPAAANAFWEQFRAFCAQQDRELPPLDRTRAECVVRARVAALTQMLAPEPAAMRLGLTKYLAEVPHVDATRALARLAIFAAEDEVRRAALDGLKVRRERDYTDILLQGLRYPLPAVAKRTGEALVKLERTDLIPQLVDLLDEADPRAPVTKKVQGKETPVVRELVKINHHRNCLLCHAPAGAAAGSGTVFTAPVPTPDQPLTPPSGGYGSAQSPEVTVRLDVTYLRQDFSVLQPMTDAQPWPEMQRFDFFVRTRSLSEEEAGAYRAKLAKRVPGTVTPYQRAALAALRELTGKDTAPTAEAWRELLGLQTTQRRTPTLSVMGTRAVD